MKPIPRFWARTPHEVVSGAERRRIKISILGWSDESHAAALAHAQHRAKSFSELPEQKDRADSYEYAGRPIREETIEELGPEVGSGIVTRNRYGALVLNSPSVAFADIDVQSDHPGVHGRRADRGFLARLFGNPDPFETALKRVRLWSERNRTKSIRLYRTFNGYRGIITSGTMSATRPETFRILEELGSDPLYIKLCKNQECFRARLTAKPWRIDCPPNHARLPLDGPDSAVEYARWIEQYDTARSMYATCKFVEEMNGSARDGVIVKTIELHDRVTGALGKLPLA